MAREEQWEGQQGNKGVRKKGPIDLSVRNEPQVERESEEKHKKEEILVWEMSCR